MKLLRSLFVLFTIVAITSCSSNDDNNDSSPTAGDGQFVATVNNSSFVSTKALTSSSLQGGVLNITSKSAGGNTISISINNFDNEGTANLSGSTNEGIAIYLPSGDNKFYSSVVQGGSGSITITEFNNSAKSISGTFSFTGVRQKTNSSGQAETETVVITNGSFKNVTVTEF